METPEEKHLRILDYKRKYNAKNKDLINKKNKEYKRLYRTKEMVSNENKRRIAKKREWAILNKDKISESHKRSYIKNKKTIQLKRKINIPRFRASRCAEGAARRFAKITRTPSWLTPLQISQIKAIYIKCGEYRNMGLNMHVDHIVPLKGKNVSGLPVPWNLRIVTAECNLTKGNKLIE